MKAFREFTVLFFTFFIFAHFAEHQRRDILF